MERGGSQPWCCATPEPAVQVGARWKGAYRTREGSLRNGRSRGQSVRGRCVSFHKVTRNEEHPESTLESLMRQHRKRECFYMNTEAKAKESLIYTVKNTE
ncbi:Angiopoietin-Like Protein 8 [Manis pentadactyla]|nr:Angiopoietin-Like Protein 8 [Manis pentadactyla]